MKLVSLAVIAGIAAAAAILYRSRHGVEVWHTTEDRPA